MLVAIASNSQLFEGPLFSTQKTSKIALMGGKNMISCRTPSGQGVH